ncbi:MAG: GNAT family N-acetyltransferase, partial [Halobacteriaceae archaeon]
MYVRGAKNREEVWLLDRLDELGLRDPAFRSRDYVIALDEQTGEKAGFGRIRIHPEGPCEFTCIGVLPDWRDQGVGAHVLERLVELARDQGVETAYALTSEGGYLSQFGFERVSEEELPDPLGERLEEVQAHDADARPFRLDLDDFIMPEKFREKFKSAGEEEEPIDAEEESPEDFGI